MIKPASESAHHHPNAAFNANPTSRIADRYAHNSVCFESATIAALPSVLPTRLFARASNGITSNDVIASAIPTQLSSGASRLHKLCSDFPSSHAPNPKNDSAINFCARRSDSRLVLPNRHTMISPELTSKMLSMPKPISATELAAAPDANATTASTTL